MATVQFVPLSGYNSAKWATARATLDDTGAVTASWVATTNDVDVVGWDYTVISCTYTTGAETLIRLRPEVYNGTDWVMATYKATQGSAVSEVTLDVLQITKANFTTGDKFTLPGQFVVNGFQKFRLSRQGTSGSTFGTLELYVNGGTNAGKE